MLTLSITNTIAISVERRAMMNDGEPDWDLDEDERDRYKEEQEEEDAKEIASLRNQ
jgi:hypothetical protein